MALKVFESDRPDFTPRRFQTMVYCTHGLVPVKCAFRDFPVCHHRHEMEAAAIPLCGRMKSVAISVAEIFSALFGADIKLLIFLQPAGQARNINGPVLD